MVDCGHGRLLKYERDFWRRWRCGLVKWVVGDGNETYKWVVRIIYHISNNYCSNWRKSLYILYTDICSCFQCRLLKPLNHIFIKYIVMYSITYYWVLYFIWIIHIITLNIFSRDLQSLFRRMFMVEMKLFYKSNQLFNNFWIHHFIIFSKILQILNILFCTLYCNDPMGLILKRFILNFC